VYVGLLYLYFGSINALGNKKGSYLDSIWWDSLGFAWDPLGFAGIRTQNVIPPDDSTFFTKDPSLPSSCGNSLGSARVQ